MHVSTAMGFGSTNGGSGARSRRRRCRGCALPARACRRDRSARPTGAGRPSDRRPAPRARRSCGRPARRARRSPTARPRSPGSEVRDALTHRCRRQLDPDLGEQLRCPAAGRDDDHVSVDVVQAVDLRVLVGSRPGGKRGCPKACRASAASEMPASDEKTSGLSYAMLKRCAICSGSRISYAMPWRSNAAIRRLAFSSASSRPLSLMSRAPLSRSSSRHSSYARCASAIHRSSR